MGAKQGHQCGGDFGRHGDPVRLDVHADHGRGRTLEVHVPGWAGEMYGDLLEVRFGRRLRPEIKFESADELRAQIQLDLEALSQAVEEGEL